MVGGPGFNRASDSGVCQATSPIMQCSCLSTLISLAYCSKRKYMMANVCEYIRQEAGRNRDEHTYLNMQNLISASSTKDCCYTNAPARPHPTELSTELRSR